MSMPGADHAQDPLRVADPHEVARLLGRQQRRRPAGRLEHLLAALPHREPAERVAVEVERRDLLDRAAAQLRVGRALRDPEEELPGARSCSRWRAAQCVVSRTASSSSARGTPAGGQMSKAIAMSEPRLRWIRAAISGENRAGAPS